MTDFLHDAGTNGFVSTPVKIIDGAGSDTSISGLTNGSAFTGATARNQASFGNAQFGYVWFNIVSAGWTPTAGGAITGWFLLSTDGGTTYEQIVASPSTSNPALPRPPDFVIPFEAAALSAGWVRFASSLVQIPWTSFKVVIQNNTGATLGTGGHTIYLGPVADKFV